MLVLMRKPRQRIHLRDAITGEEMTVVVTRAQHGRAWVGIEADQRWEIRREEVPATSGERQKGAEAAA